MSTASNGVITECGLSQPWKTSLSMPRASKENMNESNTTKKFKIPVSWSLMADVIVQADSLEEAITKAEEIELPEGEYVDGSFEVNTEVIWQNPYCFGEIKEVKA